jgi:trimeric autotransporter adhesin
MASRSRALPITLALIGLLSLSGIAGAIVPKQNEGSLGSMAFVSERLQVFTDPESIDDIRSITGAAVTGAWDSFRVEHGDWNAVIDKRTGALEIAEGQGVPFIPGRGNQLRTADISAFLAGKRSVDLATMESITRSFLPRVAGLLGVDPKSLQLNEGRSGHPAEHLWNIDFDVVRDGMVVENARVVFRVNNGNLIQFGSENLPSQGVKTPKAKLDRQGALSSLASFIGGFSAADSFVDGGSLRLVPVRLENAKFAEGYAPGQGRGLTAIWQFSFRRAGDNATWQARVDATNGEVLSLRDINEYAGVTGGAKILGTSTNVPLPFANVSSGGFTNSAGVYSFPGGAVTSTLAGQYVRVLDNCGAISLGANGAGDILFGTSAGTDCTTPGVGGAGNTHSSRTQFYHVNRAKEAARGWITRPWLTAQLTANVNINLTCNAFWNGSTINFYRSGGGCGNTGEIEAVSLHEYGHGADSNDGNGSSPENGTGETYGDWTAALGTHNSCIGGGFLTSNCGSYGDACTSCTGVRDIDWAKHASGVAHTVSNFTQVRCPTSGTGYVGPCNREGHCESYISSEALWDFVNRDLPSPGSGTAWSIGERLWYLSRSTATSAFSCTPSGTWTSNGCNAGSLWKTMRAVDDDDGNLANGTPHSANLYAAFNRHGIACTTDAGANTNFRGCTQPATPTITLTPGSNTVSVAISGSTGVYDIYRNERGCNAGFIKVTNDTASSPFTDTAVANGFTYFYQVTAQPSGNEACASAPSTCVSVTPASAPCTPPAAPTGLTATAAGANQINLSWTASAGATGYNVYRSTTSGGPYTLVGSSATTSFANTGLTCNTAYFYVVRATNSPTCESGNSTQATATTATCPVCTTTNLYTNGFETGTGLTGWSTGTFVSGGSAASWRGIQTCTAKTGTKVFRYGGTTCTADYTSNNFTFAQPGGAAGVTVPAGSTTTRLSFWHRRAFESGFDGGTLAVSIDGTNYNFAPATAILSGTTYNGTVSASCPPAGAAGAPIFTGTASTFVNTVVNLDAVCDSLTGTTGGCAGRAVRVGFTSISDCSVTGDGWFLDDVTISACVP